LLEDGSFVVLLNDTPLIIAGGGGDAQCANNLKTGTLVRQQRMEPGVVGWEGPVDKSVTLIRATLTTV